MRQNRVALWLLVSAVMPVAIISVAMPVVAANSPQVQGTKCTKSGATRVVKSVSYSCTKVGKTLKWQIASKKTTTTATTATIGATTTSTVPVSKRVSLIRTLPSYEFDGGSLQFITNTPGFQYGHQTRSVIGQSFLFDRAMTLESLVFVVPVITNVTDIDVYYRTPEPASHAMESFDRELKVPMRLHLTLSKSRLATPLLNDIEMTRDVVQLYTQTFDYVITARQPVELVFDTPLAVEPGSYLVTVRLEAVTEWVKRKIVTVWIGGFHSGNATRGQYNRTAESNCTYTRGTDFYPNGKAYKSEYVEPYVDWQSSPSRTLKTLLTEHRTKVGECIVIGNFSDIFNDGDLLMEWRGTWR